MTLFVIQDKYLGGRWTRHKSLTVNPVSDWPYLLLQRKKTTWHMKAPRVFLHRPAGNPPVGRSAEVGAVGFEGGWPSQLPVVPLVLDLSSTKSLAVFLGFLGSFSSFISMRYSPPPNDQENKENKENHESQESQKNRQSHCAVCIVRHGLSTLSRSTWMPLEITLTSHSRTMHAYQ